MDYNRFRSSKRVSLVGNATAAAILLVLGMLLEVKGLVGLSLVPAFRGLIDAVILFMVYRQPKRMLPLVISETDPRIQSVKREADSLTLRFIRWALLLLALGYTLVLPEEIFSVLWWIITLLAICSYLLQAVLLKRLMH